MEEEIWENPYGAARLKIQRANQHIDDFKNRLFTSLDRHGPSLHMDPETGEQFLRYGLGDKFLIPDLALIAGDALHNFRSALDIAWGGIVRDCGSGVTEFTKFPINPKQPRQWLEGCLKGTGIDSTSRIFHFLVNDVKTYKGGDEDILALHELDLKDKHILLIPTVVITGINGVELENEDGSIDRLDIILTSFEPFIKRVSPKAKLKDNGELRCQVSFGKGILPENRDVTLLLEDVSQKVWEIVHHISQMRLH